MLRRRWCAPRFSARYPAIRDRLAAVFGGLDAASLRQLNARIAIDGEAALKVASDYLGARGLLR